MGPLSLLQQRSVAWFIYLNLFVSQVLHLWLIIME